MNYNIALDESFARLCAAIERALNMIGPREPATCNAQKDVEKPSCCVKNLLPTYTVPPGALAHEFGVRAFQLRPALQSTTAGLAGRAAVYCIAS